MLTKANMSELKQITILFNKCLEGGLPDKEVLNFIPVICYRNYIKELSIVDNCIHYVDKCDENVNK